MRARYEKAREKRWVRWAIDATILAAIILGLSAWQTRNLLSRGTAIDLQLSTLDGEAVSLATLRGKPVVVGFWAPWCGVCKELSPNLSQVQRWVGDRAHVVSIATAFQNVSEVQRYMVQQKVEYPVWLGGETELRRFHVNAFPTLYFLDAEGRVKGSAIGYTTSASLLMRLLW